MREPPNRGTFFTIPPIVSVLERDLRHVIQRQTGFEQNLPTVESQTVIGHREPCSGGWKKSAVAVVPGAVLIVGNPDEPGLFFHQVESYLIIMLIKKRAAVCGERGPFCQIGL